MPNPFYLFTVFAQFCCVGLQITVWTYTNFYIPEQIGVSQEVALQYHTGDLALFGLSHLAFTGLMTCFRAATLPALAALGGVLLSFVVVFVGCAIIAPAQGALLDAFGVSLSYLLVPA